MNFYASVAQDLYYISSTLGRLVFSCSCSIGMYSDLDQCTNSFHILTYKFCPKPYMDKSLSLIKFTIIMCESVLDMKDCNGEVLT